MLTTQDACFPRGVERIRNLIFFPSLSILFLDQNPKLSVGNPGCLLPARCGKNLKIEILSILFLDQTYLVATQDDFPQDVERI
jgi:hypothetical protein